MSRAQAQGESHSVAFGSGFVDGCSVQSSSVMMKSQSLELTSTTTGEQVRLARCNQSICGNTSQPHSRSHSAQIGETGGESLEAMETGVRLHTSSSADINDSQASIFNALKQQRSSLKQQRSSLKLSVVSLASAKSKGSAIGQQRTSGVRDASVSRASPVTPHFTS